MTGQSPRRKQIRVNTRAEEDWAAVAGVVRCRMREVKLTTARLARETGLSESTIRYIGESGTRHNTSALVAMSAVLGWRYDYLTNVLRGEPHKNVRIKRAPLAILSAEVASLKNTVHEIDKKLDALLMREPNETTLETSKDCGTSPDGTERP